METDYKYKNIEALPSNTVKWKHFSNAQQDLKMVQNVKLHEMHSRKKICYIFLIIALCLWSMCILVLIWCGLSGNNFQEKMEFDQDPQRLSPHALHYKKFLNELQTEENFIEYIISHYVSSQLSTVPEDHLELSNNEREDTLAFPETVSTNQCDLVPLNLRFDCFPEGAVSPKECKRRGCCWRELSLSEIPRRKGFNSRLHPSYLNKGEEEGDDELNFPFCFYPFSYSLYNATDIKYKKDGITGELQQHYKSGYPKDVAVLSVEFRFETCSRVRIRISDANRQRWETPLPAVPKGMPGCQGTKLFDVQIIQQSGNIVISRSDSAKPLFDMRNAAPLIFSDQFIQLSTLLPSSYIYGLGQHLDGLLLDTYWQRRVLWNADEIPSPKSNLYGSHPFYMIMESSGSAHGVFLLNSNAIEVILQPTPALTFRVIGGILDFYVFLGPSPDQVISQYTEVIGRPFLPPYWSLGYHQCRFGYGNLEQMKKVWNRTRDAGIPFDVQWNDIDYMKNQNDFTYDQQAYAGLPQFVQELHEFGMHYVIITDPGISAGEEPGKYPPFDMGIKDDVFIKNSTGQLFIGKVWNPKATVFPDFTRPNAVIYWNYLINKFREELPFDGLWIDMNEPSNFWNGQEDGCPMNSSLENPPYLPNVNGGILYHKTLCMTAKQYLGVHYNVHNLYGFSEAIATYASLKMTNGISDPFIISRSSYPGLGAYAGHWTGDVYSDWFNLWKSIGAVLTMNLLGIPMVGADICGFNGNTTASLCNRWMQLGAFYPFSRNHNTDDGIDQDPVALGDLVIRSSRKALLQRYMLLPFLYSLFYKAHLTGIPVAKPLFFKYPQDSETFTIDTQFLWGDELMIIPVLQENATSVDAYFPEGTWYDWYSGNILSKRGREYLTLSAPLDTIPLVVAGGSVLPCQIPGNTTTQSRRNPFGLTVALNEAKKANGELVWNKPDDSGFMQWKFRAIPNHFVSVPFVPKINDEKLTLEWIKIFGVSSSVSSITVNGESVNYTYSAVSQVIYIQNLSVDFKKSISVSYFLF